MERYFQPRDTEEIVGYVCRLMAWGISVTTTVRHAQGVRASVKAHVPGQPGQQNRRQLVASVNELNKTKLE